MGNNIKRKRRKASTPTNVQNKMVLPNGFNQRKYSIKSVKRKYNKPKPIKKNIPLISSFK